MFVSEWDAAIRLAAAGLMGGIVGYERQARHKSAGLRTHILVSMGSSLIMILSINIYCQVQGLANADPARLAAQVVSGIGFLGAGSIMKEGLNIRGLTTAASLWVVAGVGLAAGGGFYAAAAITTLFVFLTLSVLARLEARGFAGASGRAATITVQSAERPGQIAALCDVFGRHSVPLSDVRIEDKRPLTIHFTIAGRDEAALSALVARLAAVEGVLAVRTDGS